MTGIYIHVPFCERKCPYCAFYSVARLGDTVKAYTDTLKNAILSFDDNVKADTLYFGGGTPPLLGAENIAEIVGICRKKFGLDGAEITVECNPNSTDIALLRELRACGVNRLSVGVQSLDDKELAFLGRLHDAAQVRAVLDSAREAGFDNVSADLMIGIKEQTSESIESSVSELSSLGASHISVYMIKVESGTAFDCDRVRNGLLGDDELAQLYLDTVSICECYGFKQYEISNFAKNGLVSRHNLKYWTGEDYIGFGPSAHSFFKSVRYCCPDDLAAYIREGQKTVVTEAAPDRAEEYVLLGLRLNCGISLKKCALFGINADRLQRMLVLSRRYEKAGLCTLSQDQDNLTLTPRGMLVSNSIISELLL
ncbi:MAG: radical SAM family heme chaperone HemW [Ruminococcus sp.]|nr:radical SAM family heme chaperone HemW [Ruminococcus sp.]